MTFPGKNASMVVQSFAYKEIKEPEGFGLTKWKKFWFHPLFALVALTEKSSLRL